MIQGKISLVLPAHNEVDNIRPVVEQSKTALPKYFTDYEILIINDGSTDDTGRVADDLALLFDEVSVVHHQQNRGYGGALRSGFTASTGDWVMIMDADRQFDPEDLIYLYPYVGMYDLVAGYRLLRSDPWHRILFGQLFKIAMATLFGVSLRDIDCAFKVIDGQKLRKLDLQSPGALISTELMARWVQQGNSWVEVGVHHYPRSAGQQSGGSLKVILRAMKETLALWYRLRREAPADQTNVKSDGRSNSTSIVMILAGVLVSALLWVFKRSGRS